MKLRGKTILITGGTSGIGYALAERLLERGNTVIVTGRDPVKLAATKRALTGVYTVRSDVADPEAIEALLAHVVAQFPMLDVLVNNAGVMRNLDIHVERDLKDVVREIDINFSGPVRMCQAFLPHLKTRDDAVIVNVSSGLAFVPLPISPIYSATKSALHAFTRSFRIQLRGSSVSVIELAPPAVETPLFRGEFAEEMKGARAMDAGVLARHAIEGIEAGKLEIRPGLSNVLKIMSRLAPEFMLKQLSKVGEPPVA